MKGKIFSTKDLIIGIIIFAAFALLQVLIISESETISTRIEKSREKLKLLNNQYQQTLVEKQKFESEDRIVRIASDSLGLVKSNSSYEIKRINKKEIEKIERIISDKYGS